MNNSKISNTDRHTELLLELLVGAKNLITNKTVERTSCVISNLFSTVEAVTKTHCSINFEGASAVSDTLTFKRLASALLEGWKIIKKFVLVTVRSPF